MIVIVVLMLLWVSPMTMCSSDSTVFDDICNRSSSGLKCISTPCFNHAVQCQFDPESTIYVRPLYCLTTDDTSPGELVVGKCISSKTSNGTSISDSITLADIKNGSTCSKGYGGMLCGKCSANHSAVLNSYGLECVEDTACHKAFWALYIIETFIPLTIFYCVILLFRFRATSGSINPFIMYAQTLTLPINIVTLRRDWELALHKNQSVLANALTKAVSVLYGIWNLDFFRGVFPYCVGRIDTLTLISIQYATAVYPLILLAFTYLLIELHARNFRFIVVLWKPVNRCLVYFGSTHPNARRTVIDAFATILLLSYAKFAHTSMVLLSPTNLYNESDSVVGTVLLFDGTVRYFHSPHIYFAIAAIVVLLVIVLPLPLLLIIYPTRCCQKCLNACNFNSNLIVAFVDSYLGCYKNGLNGTRDCRFFAGFYIALRLVLFVMYAFIANYFDLYLGIHIILFAFLVLLVVFRPYRSNIFNKLDILLMLLYTLITAAAIHNNYLISEQKNNLPFMIFFYILLLIPVVYAFCHFLLFILIKCWNKDGRQGVKPPRSLRIFFTSSAEMTLQNSLTAPLTSATHTTDLPDRLVRPNEYEQAVILNDYSS